MHPYFQWLWWIDVSSGDKSSDMEARTNYRKYVKNGIVVM